MFDVRPMTTGNSVACGPTSLRMLLDHYGIDVPLDQLVEECDLKVEGCTAADLLRVGRAHGLDMTAWRMDAEELVRQDRPAIVYWRHCHWCVVCGMDDDGRVGICNPSRGFYRMAEGTFASLYSGVCLANGEPLWRGASANVAAGELFEHDGTLYRALTAIARGERIAEGTNAARVDLADELNAINSEE